MLKKILQRGNLLLQKMGILPEKNITEMFGQLKLKIIRKNGNVEDFGVVCRKKVTDVFVNKLVDALISANYVNIWKYHDSGTGTNAENKTDTALQIPCGEARTIGSQVEGASENIYKSIAIHEYAATFAITEHGLFDLAAVGVLMDRSVFAAKNVDSGDKIEFTYELTCQSES